MPKINSLYELIKKASQEKGRPLKIICDWDECLQPLKPAMIYEKMDPNSGISFADFFESFWDNVTFANPESLTGGGFQKERKPGQKEIKSYAEGYAGKEEEKAAIEKYEQEKLEMKASPYKWESYAKSFYGRPERFKAPFLSPAEQLVQSLRENLIEKLVIISAYNVGKPGMIAAIGKITKQKETFGKFANVTLELTPMEKKEKVDGKMVSTNLRWDVIKEKYYDFDIYVDDSLKAIAETKKLFPDRIYVMPNYSYVRNLKKYDNVYFLKMSVSDITDQDFCAKAAQRIQQKQQAKSAPRVAPIERERKHLKATSYLFSLC